MTKRLKIQLLERASIPAVAKGHGFDLADTIAAKRVELSRAKVAVFKSPEDIAAAVGAAIVQGAIDGEVTVGLDAKGKKIVIYDAESSPFNTGKVFDRSHGGGMRDVPVL